MVKKKNEDDVCPECDIALDEDGTCPGCGWSKADAEPKAEEPAEDAEKEDDDWDSDSEAE
jgi:hypothetical protein